MKDVQIVVNPQNEECSFITDGASCPGSREIGEDRFDQKFDLKRVQGSVIKMEKLLAKDSWKNYCE